MKKIYVLLFFMQSVFIFAGEWRDIKVNDVIVSLPGKPDVISCQGKTAYIVSNEKCEVTIAFEKNLRYSDDEDEQKPIYIVRNSKDLEKVYDVLRNDEKIIYKYVEIELADYNLKEHKNILITDYHLRNFFRYNNKTTIHDIYVCTFLLDNYIYRIDFIGFDALDREEAKKMSEKIFNSISFSVPKTMANQFNTKQD